MKRLFIALFILLSLTVHAEVLRGGVQSEYIPNGFFGSWGVISKMISSNNPMMFNTQSRDVWTLSGYGDTLILQNLESNARSEIRIKEKSKNDELKFEREKVVGDDKNKTIYREIVKFTLYGESFSGTDDFIIEKYKNNELLQKNEATYSVAGVKISG